MDKIFPEFNAVESEIIANLSDNKVNGLTRTLRDIVKSVETNRNGG